MIDYAQFPELTGEYLEDSFVLAISEHPGLFVFSLDAVLTSRNPTYHAPRPGEHHCYARGGLVFHDVSNVEWVSKGAGYFPDASSE